MIVLLAAATPAAGGGDITVGMSAAFTGPSGGLGAELYRGAAAYFESVNQTGGVSGRAIRFVAYDDGYDPTRAIKNTVRLVEQDKADLLFGYVGTPTVTRVLPLLKRYEGRGVYLFFPFTGAEPHRLPPYDDLVFNLRASYARETRGLVDHFVRGGCRRVAVFYQVDAYGRSGWTGVRTALARHGLSVVAEATYRRGAEFAGSMKPQVELVAAGRPDAVVCVGAYEACAAFVRDARDAGLDVPVANLSFVGSERLLARLTDLSRSTGRDYTRGLVNSQVLPPSDDPTLPAAVEYRRLTETYHPGLPPGVPAPAAGQPADNTVAFEGFLDAKLLVEILRRAGPDLTPGRLRGAAEAVRGYDPGIGVPVNFGPRQHQAFDRVYLTEVRGGRFHPVAGPGEDRP